MQYPDPGIHIDGSTIALFFLAICFFFGVFTLIDMFKSWRQMSRIQHDLEELEREIYEAGNLPEYIQTYSIHDK